MSNRTSIDAYDFPRYTILDCIRAALSAHKLRFNKPATKIKLGHLEYIEFEKGVIYPIGESFITGPMKGIAWGCNIERFDDWSLIEVSDDL